MTSTVYLNGRFVADADARVSVFDGGFLHGAGLFETMRAENGRVFRLEAHLERLRKSAGRILTPIERVDLPAESVFTELLERAGLPDARVRLTISSGSLRDAGDDAPPALTVCATASPLSSYPAELYERGVHVAVCDYRVSTSDPLAGHKALSYLPRLLGMRFAQEKRCLEALWFNTRNQLAEGSISNVFTVRGGVMRTPPLETPILPGITRAVVIDLAERSGVPCEQTSLGIDDLLDADEVFLTNAIMQVMPVIRVERRDIGEGKVGPITRRMIESYRALVSKECGR